VPSIIRDCRGSKNNVQLQPADRYEMGRARHRPRCAPAVARRVRGSSFLPPGRSGDDVHVHPDSDPKCFHMLQFISGRQRLNRHGTNARTTSRWISAYYHRRISDHAPSPSVGALVMHLGTLPYGILQTRHH